MAEDIRTMPHMGQARSRSRIIDCDPAWGPLIPVPSGRGLLEFCGGLPAMLSKKGGNLGAVRFDLIHIDFDF